MVLQRLRVAALRPRPQKLRFFGCQCFILSYNDTACSLHQVEQHVREVKLLQG